MTTTALTNNRFKSTSIYGTFTNVDSTNGNILADGKFQRNLTVEGNLILGKETILDTSGNPINSASTIQFTLDSILYNIPLRTLSYIKNVTSDIQQQLSNISNGSFSNITFTGSINNLTVNLFDKISFLSNTTSDVQTQINDSNSNISTLQNKTIDILWTSGQINKTTIRNHCDTEILTFSNTINNISSTIFGYLSGLSSNIQQQINDSNSNISTLQNKTTDIIWTPGQINKTTIYNQCETTTLSFSNTLNNISTSTFSYLSGLTSNIQDQLNSLKFTNPVGMVITFAGTSTTLTGYLLCDGSSYSFQQYPYLFGVIGYTYGDAGNGYFRVPNYKGIFLRGAGLQDVQGKTYTAPELGTTMVDKMSSFETNVYVDNITTGTKTVLTGSTVSGTSGFYTTSVIGNVNFSTSFNIYNYGNNETRPVHTSVQYFIKY